jgi:uncharacterized membrane protein YphA (DoxX/SURF4 family)
MKQDQLQLKPVFLTFLRILTGWHFLYEGIIKLAADNWSSYSYLAQSKWILSGFFHWIMTNPTALAVTDFLNIWGLILIGLGLFLGILTRAASISGAFLLVLYYVVAPPFIIPPAGSHYYIINNQLIEAAVLIGFALVRKDYMWGIDRLMNVYFRDRKNSRFPSSVNHELPVTAGNRREFIKNMAVLPVFGGALFGMAQKVGWLSFEEEGLKKADAISNASVINRELYDLNKLEGKVPTGKIKNMEISRMIPGGNLIAGFAHARDLIYVSKWIKQYHSDEKVIETLWRFEDVGIKTVILRTDEQTIRILKKFWSRGGKIQWLAQTYPDKDDFSNIRTAIDNGAEGAFVMGNIADKMVYNNQLEYLAKPVEFIRSQGLVAGIAAHAIHTPKSCIAHGIEPDFFMKTMHHDRYWSAHPKENRNEFIVNEASSLDHNQQHDNIWCVDAEETAAFFKDCNIPWIAYKVLAAGAINPEDGFKYAFANGADFICVGMFDFQVIDNANVVYNTLNSQLGRERKWFA